MMAMRITPRLVGWCMAVTALYAAVCSLTGHWTRVAPAEPARYWSVLPFASGAAFLIGLMLCMRIAREYERGSWMRTSWLLLSAYAGVSCARFSLEGVALAGPAAWLAAREWREVPVTVSFILLSAALLAMLRSFTTLGLGFSASRADYLLLLAILAVTPTVVLFREELADAQSSYLLVRYLQYLNPLLLAFPAALSVPLYRISRQMGGGLMATSLQLLMLSIVIRTMLYVRVVPALAAVPAVVVLHSVLSPTTSWLFALAVACRWRLTVEALNSGEPRLEEAGTRA